MASWLCGSIRYLKGALVHFVFIIYSLYSIYPRYARAMHQSVSSSLDKANRLGNLTVSVPPHSVHSDEDYGL